MVTLNTCYTQQFYTGLEADTKPLGVPNGSMFLVMDTGKLYRFDAENQIWIDQANPTPSGGSEMFIITLSFDGDETYTVDKTYAEILEAFEDGQIPVVVGQDGGQTNVLYLEYFYATENANENDTVVFSTLPVITNDGVVANTVVITENDNVSFSMHSYPFQ